MGKLYVWVNPLKSAPLVDHTWVTDYNITTKNYPKHPDGKNYWYCWGSYHKSAQHGMLLSVSGTLKHAKALVLSNVKPPPEPMARPARQDGSITFYAIDGLCHQVANQILYSTGMDGTVPDRVSDARGYHLATFFYRNYGLNDRLWNKNRKTHCPGVTAPDDDFLPWLKGASGADLSKNQVTRVLMTRRVAQWSLKALRREAVKLSKHEYEYAVGLILSAALVATASEVGEKNFFKLFPSLDTIPRTTDELIQLLDTEQMEISVKACRETLRANPEISSDDI